jgi:hypothetical protein
MRRGTTRTQQGINFRTGITTTQSRPNTSISGNGIISRRDARRELIGGNAG